MAKKRLATAVKSFFPEVGGIEMKIILYPKHLNMLTKILGNSVQTFQQTTYSHRRGNFVYNHWGCISIYRSLS